MVQIFVSFCIYLDDSNPKLELAEKDLLAKLDPSPDENEKKIINPESKAKREAFAAAGAK